ncbi:MAG: hypothetical protein ACJAZ3_000808 [Sphingobacteriales bacterium]|jgi:hypothetical protein
MKILNIKNYRTICLCLIAFGLFFTAQAQTEKSIAVIAVSSNGISFSNQSDITRITQHELTKASDYLVVDHNYVMQVAAKSKNEEEACVTPACFCEIGKVLNADLVLSGSIDKLFSKTLISFRIFDVKTQKMIASKSEEFIDSDQQIPVMIRISLLNLLNQPLSEELTLGYNQLKTEGDFVASLTHSKVKKLKNNGPRVGAVLLTGQLAQRLEAGKENGGYGGYPAMFLMAYQFEQTYINHGNIQGLIEYLPAITGLDQGLFIPSFTILNGIRNNSSGFEFAVGPQFALNKVKKGVYEEGVFYSPDEAYDRFGNADNTELIAHSDGYFRISTAFVFAVGKTFRSGGVNYPVNLFCIPDRDSFRIGLSLGFNAAS